MSNPSVSRTTDEPRWRFRGPVTGALAAWMTVASLATLLSAVAGAGSPVGHGAKVLIGALGLSLLGLAVLARSWSWTPSHERPGWAAIVIGAGLAAAALWSWRTLRDAREKALSVRLQAEAVRVEEALRLRLESRLFGLMMAARPWQGADGGARSPALRELVAQGRELAGFQAIGTLSPERAVQWVLAEECWDTEQDLSRLLIEQSREVLSRVRQRRAVAVSRAVRLPRTGWALGMYAPLLRGDQFEGWLLGVVPVLPFLDASLRELEPALLRRWAVSLADGERQMGRHLPVGAMAGAEWEQQLELRFPNGAWQLRLRPTRAWLSQVRSPLPEVVLVFGLLMAGLVGLAGRLGQSARRGAILARQSEQRYRTLVEAAEQRRAHDEITEKTEAIRALSERLQQTNQALLSEMAQRAGAESARQESEVALRQSELRFELFMRHLPGVAFMKDRDGRYVFVNEPAQQMLGLSGRAWQGKRDEELFPPEAARPLQQNDRLVIDKGIVLQTIESVPTAEQARHFLVTKFPLLDQAGRPILIGGVGVDVTQQRQADEALKRSVNALARSNQELERLASAAARELREPLSKLASYTQLLVTRHRGQMGDEAERFMDAIIDGAARVQALTSSLLIYARAGRVEAREEVELGEAAADALSALEAGLQKSGAEVTVTEMPRVRAGRAQMIQLLQQLLSNAVTFRSARPPSIALSAGRRGGEWVIAVRDNGIGIAEEDLARIFGMFERGHGRPGDSGSGIGLAICQNIVESHGGRIWAESVPGQGSVFSFTLPA